MRVNPTVPSGPPRRPLLGLAPTVGVLKLYPVAVAAVHDRTPPLLVGDIPLDRLEQPCLERFGRAITRLERSLHRIDRVTPVVHRTILHKRDELGGVPAQSCRAFGKPLSDFGVSPEKLVDVSADPFYNIDVLALGVSTQVVRFTQPPLLQHSLDPATVVAHE